MVNYCVKSIRDDVSVQEVLEIPKPPITSPGQHGDGIRQSEQTSPHTKYPERDKPAAPACQVATGKGG